MLPISKQRQMEIRADITRRLIEAKRGIPTDEQWAMILSDSTCVRVVAGAGSGKSTTLVYRLVVLHFYLGVDWGEISVVTFTNNSRDDFVEKLISAVALWGDEMSSKQAEGIVRTFHSLGFGQAVKAGLMVDTIDKPPPKGTASKFPKEQQRGSEVELPFGPHRVDPEGPIAKMLNRVAAELMQTNATFAQAVFKLYDSAFLRQRDPGADMEIQEKRIYAVQKNDAAQTAYMEKLWRETIAPELMEKELITWMPGRFFTGRNQPGQAASRANGPWWANAKLPQLSSEQGEVWLLLGATPENASNVHMPAADKDRPGFPVVAAIAAKKNCVNTLSSTTPLVWVNSADDLIALHERLTYRPEQMSEFPKFKVKLTGDKYPDWLLLLFWKEAQFAQSLGVDVRSACKDAAGHTKSVDHHFAVALGEFWPAFEQHLQAQGVNTSAGVFRELGERQTIGQMPEEILRSTKHLMVDEFQDISGNLVKWIANLRTEHIRRASVATSAVPPSFMVVGDDFQAIYGWRGSSPRYFTRFAKYFGAGLNPTTVLLSKNFRSSQPIIDAALCMLADVKEKVDKPAIAHKSASAATAPVHVLNGERALEDAPFDELEPTDFILSRTHSSRDGIESRATGMSVHGSKGLEATRVVMVDDIVSPPAHPLRASFYRSADLGDYNQAMREESHRLAYVAITRAKEQLIWAVKEPAGDGMFNIFMAAMRRNALPTINEERSRSD